MLFYLVERRGFEPLTPTLPVWCAPSCANAPDIQNGIIIARVGFLCKGIIGQKPQNLTKRAFYSNIYTLASAPTF